MHPLAVRPVLAVGRTAIWDSLVPDCHRRNRVCFRRGLCNPDGARSGTHLRDVAFDRGRISVNARAVTAVGSYLADKAVDVGLDGSAANSTNRIAFDVQVNDPTRSSFSK